MKKILSTKTCMAGSLAAILFALFALTTATSAPVVVIPGEGAGYIYYGASAGPAPEAAPAEDPTLVGQISAFARQPPDNWIICDGRTISATEYPLLVRHLSGESATLSTVPDLRGEFLRGLDTMGIRGARQLDPDWATRTVLAAQRGSIERHKHLTAWGEHPNYASAPFGRTGASYSGSGDTDGGNSWFLTNDGADWAIQVNPPGVIGGETRPRNVAVIYAIRAK